MAHHRVDHVRRLDRRGRRDPRDRTGRALPDQLPAARPGRGVPQRGHRGQPAACWSWRSSRPTIPWTAWLDRALAIAAEHHGTVVAQRDARPSRPDDASSTWRSSFLRMPYQRDALARRSVIAETFETACTWDGFEDLHTAGDHAARSAVERVCGVGVVTCRFTHVYPDGPAPYYGVYAAGRWDALAEQWDEIKAAVSDAIIAHGGTITHHHAVGRDHRPWYDRQRPEPFAGALRAMKTALDPGGIMNPGVLIDVRG